MSTTVALWNIIGEAQHLFVVGVVPLHGDVDGNVGALVRNFSPVAWKIVGCNTDLFLLMYSTKPRVLIFKRKQLFFASTVIIEFDAHTVVQEREFTNTLG